jgi:hypothetical protein
MSRKSENPEKPKNNEKIEKPEKPEKSKSSSGQMRDKLRFRDYWHEKGKFYTDTLNLRDPETLKIFWDLKLVIIRVHAIKFLTVIFA